MFLSVCSRVLAFFESSLIRDSFFCFVIDIYCLNLLLNCLFFVVVI